MPKKRVLVVLHRQRWTKAETEYLCDLMKQHPRQPFDFAMFARILHHHGFTGQRRTPAAIGEQIRRISQRS